MTKLAVNLDKPQSLQAAQAQQLPSSCAAINKLRGIGAKQLKQTVFPTVNDEDWRFSDISRLTQRSWNLSSSLSQLVQADLAAFYLEEASICLVFINGVYTANLSDLSLVPSGIEINNLPLSRREDLIQQHLGQLDEGDLFTATSNAFMCDGALLYIPANLELTTPVQLLFIASQGETISYPRTLVIVDKSSSLCLIEDYVIFNEGDSSANLPPNSKLDASANAAPSKMAYCSLPLSEIILADNAKLEHIRIQREGLQGIHLATCFVSQQRDSRYHSVSINLGAQISRYNLKINQNGPGAECSVDGLTMINKFQLSDTHSCILHEAANGTSHQLHKCIVNGAAHAVFNGQIIVNPGAQQVNSHLASHNLLLSSKAHVDTKPQLEIFADDVKCTHGATVGQLDEEEIFYLQSRGLSALTARSLLSYAFGAEVIDRIGVKSLQHKLKQTVLQQTWHLEPSQLGGL